MAKVLVSNFSEVRRRRTGGGVTSALAGLVCAGAMAMACGGDSAPSGRDGPSDAGVSASRQAATGRRVALVVGNDTYVGLNPLLNAVNDARAVAAALEDVGFVVERVEETTREALVDAVATFVGSLRPDDAALFYFAGHGMEVDGVNYLIPTDFTFDPQAEDRVAFDAVSATDVRERMERARVAMLVFDACRDNPYRGSRGGGGGLAAMDARGTLIAYAAGAGEVAADAAAGAENGLFTSKFVEALAQPGLTASDLFRRVRREVFAASNEQQRPALDDELLVDFVFRPADGAPGGGAGAALASSASGGAGAASAGDADRVAHEQETVFWESIRESRDPADFRAYKRRFPGGVYEELADNRLAALTVAVDVPRPARPDAGGALTAAADVPTSVRPDAGEREALWRAIERALRLDAADRRRAQRALRTLGYDPGSADGVFGAGTRATIRSWQASRGVEATGYLSAADALALGDVAGSKEATRRVALVIGNADYPGVPLENTVNDARDVAAALGEHGFDVMLRINADRRGMVSALSSFGERSAGAEVALVYWAGHSAEWLREHYLAPVDVSSRTAQDLHESSVALSSIVGAMWGAQMHVVILDAVRSDPFGGRAVEERCEANLLDVVTYRWNASVPFVLMTATAPGGLAGDGPRGGNSPYTADLLRHLRQPGVDLSRDEDLWGVVHRVGREVPDATGGEQHPCVYAVGGGSVATIASP